MEKKSLRDWRNEKHLTQKEFAKKIGVTQATVSSWERGRIKMTKTIKLATAYVLKINPEMIDDPVR